MRTPTMGARAFIPVALAGAVLLTLAPGAIGTANAAEPKTEAQQIIKIAKAQRGDPWKYGASGPRAFDCSGLVIYSYKQAGDLKVIGKGKYPLGPRPLPLLQEQGPGRPQEPQGG